MENDPYKVIEDIIENQSIRRFNFLYFISNFNFFLENYEEIEKDLKELIEITPL